MISFDIGSGRAAVVTSIVQHAIKRGVIKRREALDYRMSLHACIAQGCDLDLDKLAAFDDFNLAHDLHGIYRHIDKDDNSPNGGKLRDHFLPRCHR